MWLEVCPRLAAAGCDGGSGDSLDGADDHGLIGLRVVPVLPEQLGLLWPLLGALARGRGRPAARSQDCREGRRGPGSQEEQEHDPCHQDQPDGGQRQSP